MRSHALKASTTQGHPELSSALKASALGGQGAGEPVEALIEPIARGGARGLDEPLAVPQVVQSQLLGDFCGGHGLRQVLNNMMNLGI